MMNTEAQYRQEWAVKSGRPASDVYVPEALRPPLEVGDRIRVLKYQLQDAEVVKGDILTVIGLERDFIRTNTPRLRSTDLYWAFDRHLEGVGWERVSVDVERENELRRALGTQLLGE